MSAREVEEAHLIGVLRELHEDDPEGGYRVLSDDIAERGYQLSERCVWRLCRVAGIRSTITARKRRYRTAGPPVHDDLVNREFTAHDPNQLWLTDITEHRTAQGRLYCCAVQDVYSNRIVGYSIDSRMKARIAVNAVEMAIAHRGIPEGVIVHSDRGSQFRSRKFVKARHTYNLIGSMGRVGACGDNAVMESFFSLLQKNVLDRHLWATRAEPRSTVRLQVGCGSGAGGVADVRARWACQPVLAFPRESPVAPVRAGWSGGSGARWSGRGGPESGPGVSPGPVRGQVHDRSSRTRGESCGYGDRGGQDGRHPCGGGAGGDRRRAGDVEGHGREPQPGGVGVEAAQWQVRQRPVLQLRDHLLDDRVPAVGRVRLDRGEVLLVMNA